MFEALLVAVSVSVQTPVQNVPWIYRREIGAVWWCWESPEFHSRIPTNRLMKHIECRKVKKTFSHLPSQLPIFVFTFVEKKKL